MLVLMVIRLGQGATQEPASGSFASLTGRAKADRTTGTVAPTTARGCSTTPGGIVNSDRDEIRGGWDSPVDDQSDAESAAETTGEFTIDYAPPAWYTQNASGSAGRLRRRRPPLLSLRLLPLRRLLPPMRPLPLRLLLPLHAAAPVPPVGPPVAVPKLPVGSGFQPQPAASSSEGVSPSGGAADWSGAVVGVASSVHVTGVVPKPEPEPETAPEPVAPAEDESVSEDLGSGDLESGATMRFSAVALKREIEERAAAAEAEAEADEAPAAFANVTSEEVEVEEDAGDVGDDGDLEGQEEAPAEEPPPRVSPLLSSSPLLFRPPLTLMLMGQAMVANPMTVTVAMAIPMPL